MNKVEAIKKLFEGELLHVRVVEVDDYYEGYAKVTLEFLDGDLIRERIKIDFDDIM